MTRQHFVLIADAFKAHTDQLKHHLGGAWGDLGLASARRLASSMADSLAATNPAFDRARFIAACGVDLPIPDETRNLLTRSAIKAAPRRFTQEPITGFGAISEPPLSDAFTSVR